MKVRRDKFGALTVRAVLALAGIASSGFGAAGSDDAAGKAWEAYSQAQRQWQQELAGFLSSRRPDLEGLIAATRDSQLALIHRRSLEFRYLLAKHPERIVSNQGISHLASFHWTDDDRHALMRSSPDYAAAVKRIDALQKSSDGNPQWPALRAANQSLAKDAAYQKIYGRFEERVKAAGKLLTGDR